MHVISALKIMKFTSLTLVVICGGDAAISMRTENMSGSDHYSLISRKKDSSELQKFASWFHQDWEYVYPDFYQGARMYLAPLPPERRMVLRQELQDFISENANASPVVIKKLWLQLGAQGWQSSIDIGDGLQEFLRMM